MPTRALLAFLTLAASAGLRAQSQDPAVKAILEEGLKRSQVMVHLDHLTNRIGPRLTGSDRLTQACEWAVERFKSFGLEARMEKWGEFPVGFNRGGWSGRMLEPEIRALTFGTAAWSAGTTGRQKGEAVMAPAGPDEVKRAKGHLKGRWVLEPGDLRKAFGKKGKPDGDARSGAQILDALYAEEGILGIIRSTGSELVLTGGHYQISWDSLPTRVEINMIEEDWQAVAKHAKGSKKPVLEFWILNNFKKGPIPLYNVIADLKGTEIPDQCVIVGGHIDSWDGAAGTTDNGTGAATTIEAARILVAAGAKPRRTVRFMLWSGEEQGLLGSTAWVQAHQDELESISAVFVHDGGTNYVSGVTGTAAHVADFERIFAPVATVEPEMPFKIRKVDGLPANGSSDHASFLAMGVPGFYWDQAGKAKYGYGWHTQNDTYDLAVPEYQRHTATVAAAGAYGVANLDHLLSREGLRTAGDAIPTGRRLGVDLDEKTMSVTAVTAGSAAEKAGVKTGDVLLELDDVELKDRYVLRKTVNSGAPKKKLVVRRAGEKLALELAWER